MEKTAEKLDANDPDLSAFRARGGKSEAPSAIVATKYVDDDPAKGVKATRPLCPYPQAATYKGQGDPSEAASFSCTP